MFAPLVPRLWPLPPEDAPLDGLALGTSGACVGGSHRTIPNRKGVLTGHPSRAQCRGSRKKRPAASLPLTEVYLHPLKAAAEGAGFQSAGITPD